jgi:Tfp pilus assembly protein PilN
MLKAKEFEKKSWYIIGSLIVAIFILATLTNFVMWHGKKKSHKLMRTSAIIDRYTSFIMEIGALQNEINDLKNRLDFIEKVSKERRSAIEVLTEMMKFLPNNLWLTEVIQEGDIVTVTGRTEGTFDSINTFKEALVKSGHFDEVKVESANVLKDKEGSKDLRVFTIKMKMVP